MAYIKFLFVGVLFLAIARTCAFLDEEIEEQVYNLESEFAEFTGSGGDSNENEKEDFNDICAFETRLSHGLIHYSRTGEQTPQLRKDLRRIQNFSLEAPKEKFSVESFLQEFTVCNLCNIVVKIMHIYREFKGPKSVAEAALKLLCYQIQTKRVCDGLIHLNIDIFLYIFDHKPNLKADKVCNIIGQSFNCKKDVSNKFNWEVNIPSQLNRTFTPKIQQQLDRPLRIMQITDIHYDYKYEAGSNAKCDEPLCCGRDQGKPKLFKDGAGYWGDYRSCDMPLYAVENMLQNAAKHDVDFVYHTGDIVNHRVWETSVEICTNSIVDVTNLFRKYFHNKTVFHILGNHEPNPLNEFAPEQIVRDDLSTHWLYDLVSKEWSDWLPNDTKTTILKGGYYTVLVKPGFRIVALNSNVCYTFNWWLLYNDVDPYKQLQWLSDVLHKAELDGEYVHILSHVPSGEKDCYIPWSRQYNKIIKRFAHIITAQFVGHTHYNELNLYYDDNKPEPINVAFNGGSVTTYQNVNPNFRIYDVNPTNYQVENYEDWIYNITEANRYKFLAPRWFKLYSFKEAYGLHNLSLPELGKFADSLSYNSTRRQTYFRLKVRDGDPFLEKGCDSKCEEENLCNLVTHEYGQKNKCDKLLEKYHEVNRKKTEI